MTRSVSAVSLILSCQIFCVPLDAQAFKDLATNGDGSILYFSSTVREKGTEQKFYSKIFRWTAAEGVRVIAEVRDTGTTGDCEPTEFYQLHTPQVSADGSVFAYTATRMLRGGRFCPLVKEPNQGVIVQVGRTTRLAGNIALSPNGRYAVSTAAEAMRNEVHTITDLTTGGQMNVAGAFNGLSGRVTNDGTIVTPKPSAIILTDRTGQTRVVTTRHTVSDAIINPSGTTVVYSSAASSQDLSGRLVAINLQTGSELQLAGGGLAPPVPLLTTESSTLFYIYPGPRG